MIRERDYQPELANQVNHAVADAIMVSFATQIHHRNQQKPFHIKYDNGQVSDASKLEWQKAFTEVERNQCLFNSMLSGIFLADRYASLFSQVFLIHARVEPGSIGKPFKRGTWNAHAGLVMQDVTGNWHYITPANHIGFKRPSFVTAIFKKFTQNEPSNPLLTHLQADSLEALMQQVEKVETNNSKRLWPTNQEITTQVQEPGNATHLAPQPSQPKLIMVYKETDVNQNRVSSVLEDVSYLRTVFFEDK